MVKKIFVLNGRSVEGIAKDATARFPGAEVIVLVGEGDQLSPPAGFPTQKISRMGGRNVLVLNGGGTSAQFWATKLALAENLGIVNLQRDGMEILNRPGGVDEYPWGKLDPFAREYNNREEEWFSFWTEMGRQ